MTARPTVRRRTSLRVLSRCAWITALDLGATRWAAGARDPAMASAAARGGVSPLPPFANAPAQRRGQHLAEPRSGATVALPRGRWIDTVCPAGAPSGSAETTLPLWKHRRP